MKSFSSYIIRQDTMALLPHDSENGELWTLVVEENEMKRVARSPLAIIHDSCSYFGATYIGRKKGAVLMGYKSMPPICICSELSIYFFPLMSEANRECVWLAHSHVKQWEPGDGSTVKVKLTHDRVFEVPVHKNAFVNKVFRTAQYRYQLRERVAPYRRKESILTKDEPEYFGKLYMNERGTYSFLESNQDDA